MNNGPLLFLGVFATLASSFWGLLLVPELQLGGRQQVTNSATLGLYPQPRSGSAKAGAEVYRSLGCVECHTEQMRGVGADLARGWGPRKTVPQDYLGDYPVMLGAQRIGPDLADLGVRQTNATDLLRHIFSPQLSVPDSMMPPYRFLFERRELKPGQATSPEAVALEMGGGGPNYEVVPLPEANYLADYLLSLRANAPLLEAPMPKSITSTNEAPDTNATNIASTNTLAAPNTATNAPPANPVK